MHSSVLVQTIHYAHILIYPANGLSDTDEKLRAKLDAKVNSIIHNQAAKHGKTDQIMDSVELDPEFRCNMLTEVGLYGTSLEAVSAAANEIATWASSQKKLKLATWKDGERKLL